MSQQEINEEILTILTALIHSDDNYKRECVDLNANAFLMRLKDMILPPKVSYDVDFIDDEWRATRDIEEGEEFTAPPAFINYIYDSLPRTKNIKGCSVD